MGGNMPGNGIPELGVGFRAHGGVAGCNVVEDAMPRAGRERIVGGIDGGRGAGGIEKADGKTGGDFYARCEVDHVIITRCFEDGGRRWLAVFVEWNEPGPASDAFGERSCVVAHGGKTGDKERYSFIQGGRDNRLCATLADSIGDERSPVPFRLGGEDVDGAEDTLKHAPEIMRIT